MTRHLKSRKRGLPDWIGGEDDSDSGDSLKSAKDKLENKQIPKHNIVQNVVKPSYKYLPGNKHSQTVSNSTRQDLKLRGPTPSLDDMVSLSMPFITYTGSCIYSHNYSDCSLICEDILSTYVTSLVEDECLYVGFDLEWPVNFTAGKDSGKVALVQLSISEAQCYLFHISVMGSLPKNLKQILENDKIKKIGVNIEGDLWKLTKDYDFDGHHVIKTSMIDLGKYANQVLKSSGVWSLEGLCKNVLKMRMNKDNSIRCSQWDEYPLSDSQTQYAAIDAYVSLKIYNTLKSKL